MFDSLFDSIFNSVDSSVGSFSLTSLLIALGAALALGLLISLVYQKTHKYRSPTRSFSLTLAVLPAVITIIILLVGNSIARAFSLAGTFAIIRFRSAPGDPKDITYVLLSMAVGLCCGMGHLLYGAIATVVLCTVMVVLELLKFGQPKQPPQTVKITVPEDLDFNRAFDDIFAQYTSSFRRVRVKTIDLGSLFELQYSIVAKKGIDEKAFIDALRCRNGNLSISLVMDEQENEF